MERHDPAFADHYQQMWRNRTADEISKLAHIKRFMEAIYGDEDFRRTASASHDPVELDGLARSVGSQISPIELLPLFNEDYAEVRNADLAADWPLVAIWSQYVRELLQLRKEILLASDSRGANPRFDRWRVRQISRANSEIGPGADGIVHPLIAYELSKGCSVGCWFCGISAEKFEGHFELTAENRLLWEGVLGVMRERFGGAAATGFCYWATDPLDNPDYPEFLKIFHAENGVVPQTTTAIPLRDLALTRRVLDLWKTHRCVINRFSVLTPRILRQIHEAFTPEELLGVELVLQNRGSVLGKVGAGRALTREPAPARAPRALQKGTIACVTGFIVNMVERRIRLVSPTPASEIWPEGYIVFGERTFQDVSSFADAIDSLVDNGMVQNLKPENKIRFRSDLNFERCGERYELKNEYYKITSGGWGDLGELIAGGGLTVGEVAVAACRQGLAPVEVVLYLDDNFQAGLLVND